MYDKSNAIEVKRKKCAVLLIISIIELEIGLLTTSLIIVKILLTCGDSFIWIIVVTMRAANEVTIHI